MHFVISISKLKIPVLWSLTVKMSRVLRSICVTFIFAKSQFSTACDWHSAVDDNFDCQFFNCFAEIDDSSLSVRQRWNRNSERWKNAHTQIFISKPQISICNSTVFAVNKTELPLLSFDCPSRTTRWSKMNLYRIKCYQYVVHATSFCFKLRQVIIKQRIFESAFELALESKTTQ